MGKKFRIQQSGKKGKNDAKTKPAPKAQKVSPVPLEV